MIFISAYILMSASLIAWQLWPKTKMSGFFGMLSLMLLIVTGISIFFMEETGISKLAFLSICLFLVAILSLIAGRMKNAGFLKLPYLLTSIALIAFVSNFLAIKTKTYNNPLIEKDFVSEVKLFSQGELLVQVKENNHKSFVAYAQKSPYVQIQRAFFPARPELTTLDDFYVLDLLDESPKRRKKIIKAITNIPGVIHVEENEVIDIPTLELAESTTRNATQYLYQDPLNIDQWALEKTGMNAVYKLTENLETKKNARLFILDTGVDSEHEDISEVFIKTTLKNDTDKKGHGTHCAGIAGAVTGNNIGISSFNAKNTFTISSIKVLADFGGGTQNGIIKGMITAIDEGADVISMSLGGRSTDARQRAYNEVVEYANKSNVIIIVAAGNSSAKAINYSPANSTGVITVAAIDSDMQLANFSNSLDGIDMGLSAPGVDILSTYPGNRYEKFSGTSMATPFVAGLAATMKSIKPELTTRELYDLLNDTGIVSQDNKMKNIVNPAAALEGLLNNM